MQAVFSTMLPFKLYVCTVDSPLHVDHNVDTLGKWIFLDPVRLDKTVQSDSTYDFASCEALKYCKRVDPVSGEKRQKENQYTCWCEAGSFQNFNPNCRTVVVLCSSPWC